MGVFLPAFYVAVGLGITFDLPRYSVRRELVYGDLNNKGEMEEKDQLDLGYKVISSSKDVTDFLGIDARFAIQTKRNNANSVLSSVIKSSVISRETIVEIMITSNYIRAIEKVPSGQKVLDSWKSKKPDEVGTHYVKNFVRGGFFITSIVFQCGNAEKKEKVLKAVISNLNHSGKIDENFIGKMQKIKESLGTDYVNYKFGAINCLYCGFPSFNNLEELIKVIKEMPNKVKTSDNGYGARSVMELEELSKISDFPAYQENSKVIEKLDEINQIFDDVTIAFAEFKRSGIALLDLNKDEEKEVNEFYKKTKKCHNELLNALSNLDISPTANLKQFDEFYNAYGLPYKFEKYQEEFWVLRDKVKKNVSK